HPKLAGYIPLACHSRAFLIHHHHVRRPHRPLAHAGGGYQNSAAVESYGQVSIHRRYEPALMQHAAVANNLFPVFPFSGHGILSSGEWRKGRSYNPRIVSHLARNRQINLPDRAEYLGPGFEASAPPVILTRVGFRIPFSSSRRTHCPGTPCRSRCLPHAARRASHGPVV